MTPYISIERSVGSDSVVVTPGFFGRSPRIEADSQLVKVLSLLRLIFQHGMSTKKSMITAFCFLNFSD